MLSKNTQFRHKIAFFQTNFDLKTKNLTLHYKNVSNFVQKYTISTQNWLFFPINYDPTTQISTLQTQF